MHYLTLTDQRDVTSSHSLVHMNFKTWPDTGVPDSGLPILQVPARLFAVAEITYFNKQQTFHTACTHMSYMYSSTIVCPYST